MSSIYYKNQKYTGPTLDLGSGSLTTDNKTIVGAINELDARTEANQVFYRSESYTDNLYFQNVIITGWKLGNIALLNIIVRTNQSSDAVTLPVSLPTSLVPSADTAFPAVIRYNTTTTAFVVTTGSQITIDHTLANTWYNASVCYVTAQ